MAQNELRGPAKILYPTDFSQPASAAAAHVRAIARHFQSHVLLLHVVEPVSHPFEEFREGMQTTSRSEMALKRLEEFAAAELKGISVENIVMEGDPAEVISLTAKDTGTDLIVMGTRGRGPFRRFLIGSATAKVLNDNECPVLTGIHLENPPKYDDTLKLETVVCALSTDDRGKAALAAAARIARNSGARLHVVHAIESDSIPDAAAVEKWIADAGITDLAPMKLIAKHGQPAKVVRKAAEDSGADLVVIGRSSPGPLGRLRTNSYSIIRESPCAVLSV